MSKTCVGDCEMYVAHPYANGLVNVIQVCAISAAQPTVGHLNNPLLVHDSKDESHRSVSPSSLRSTAMLL